MTEKVYPGENDLSLIAGSLISSVRFARFNCNIKPDINTQKLTDLTCEAGPESLWHQVA